MYIVRHVYMYIVRHVYMYYVRHVYICIMFGILKVGRLKQALI